MCFPLKNVGLIFSALTLSTLTFSSAADELPYQWLAGDHHVHSQFSAKWNVSFAPPLPIFAGDAKYATNVNAKMAAYHGLSWMVTTDHGGPHHSQVNFDNAYPQLLAARHQVPELLIYYGMEFDVPGARHATLMIPYSADEAEQLRLIESRFNRREAYPKTEEAKRDNNDLMLEALAYMQQQTLKPIVIANHPGRKAPALGQYQKVTPAKLRGWQDTAPDVLIGMTGAPGHQASTLNQDDSIKPDGVRAEYYESPTLGGYDQMTAQLGGVWDSFIGEGRHWWISGVSDSHGHYSEGRTDFWPGEYTKTYVYAQKTYTSVMENLRAGHSFVTTGDLIDALDIRVSNSHTGKSASLGDTLTVQQGQSVDITIRFHDPDQPNFAGRTPQVARVDVIMGNVSTTAVAPDTNTNPSTKVVNRYYAEDWQSQGQTHTVRLRLDNLNQSQYLRIRGTNLRDELEPQPDGKGENPWDDLWFYSNPVFIQVSR